MAADFTIRQNDTKPFFNTTLTDPTGTPAQLTSASVVLKMRDQATGQLIITGSCVIVSPTTGQVSYHWVPSDTLVSGWYNATFIVTYPDTSVESYPNNASLQVQITPVI